MSLWNKLEKANEYLAALAENTDSSGLPVDLIKVAGNSIAVNSGNLSTGVQRIAVATDDVNLAAINTSAAVLPTIDTNINIISDCVTSINKLKINICEVLDQVVATNAGNAGAATLRVCIATDDVNIAAMKAKIDQIHTILDDVYDNVTGTLKVTVVP